MHKPLLSLCAAALLAALPTIAAGAPPANPSVDQFRQIDQHCALNTGCFPGDDPGFPVTITESGSYFLNSNLDVSGEAEPLDTTAIVLAAPGIALDLAGYSLIGVVGCFATPVTGCSGSGTGVGVRVNAFNTGAEGKGAKITNGTIRGFGSHGIQCDTDCWIDALLTMENAGRGIDADFGDHHSTVLRSQSVRNRSDGFRLRGLVADSTARGNGGFGFRINGVSGMVRGCTSSKNLSGIAAHPGGSVLESTTWQNALTGIFCNSCLLTGNLSFDNGTYGILFFTGTTTSAWGGNSSHGNGIGAVDGAASAVEIAPNACDGALCP